MCPSSQQRKNEIKAYYISVDVTEIEFPSDFDSLPQLGDNPETGILAYLLISNGEEITIIVNEQEFMLYQQQQQEQEAQVNQQN